MALDAPEKPISRREAIPTNIVHYRGESLPALPSLPIRPKVRMD